MMMQHYNYISRQLSRKQIIFQKAKLNKTKTSSTQASIIVDPPFDGYGYSFSLSRTRFDELHMD